MEFAIHILRIILSLLVTTSQLEERSIASSYYSYFELAYSMLPAYWPLEQPAFSS